jgi:glycosyltransferase involved in cell wall biosynthesis
MNPKFSVLISLYEKENPSYFRQAMESIFHQTLMPDEVILVLDGYIPQELMNVLNIFVEKYSEILRVIPLKENVGLGSALNEGLQYCKYDYVARMDTDDICMPNRFERQIKLFVEHPEVSVVGSWVDEFSVNPQQIVSTRKLPEAHTDLVQYFKSRNPLNHPSVMFKKQAILKVGGYKHFYLLEDYYLWARLIYSNYKLYNIQESLLLFRANPQMMSRRGGFDYAKSEVRLFNEFRKLKLISLVDFCKNVLIRVSVRLLPNGCRTFLYEKLLRR